MFHVKSSRHHGNVQAVLTAMRRLGMDKLLASVPSRARDLVMAMIAARILDPGSKLGTTRTWHTTTLPSELGVEKADEDDLYSALDWLLERQGHIEKKLAARHLEPCGLVLYDLTSTWMTGSTCPLAKRGYSRDGKRGTLQVNFGLLTDEQGRPVAVQVYEGNTGDPATVQDQVTKIREQFGVELVVLVGDRGMITQARIDSFNKSEEGVGWITALRSGAIRKLKTSGHLQLDLFDERNLFEFTSPDYPDERLVACRNPEQARRRAHKRQELLAATKKALDAIQRSVRSGRLVGAGKIGIRVGKVINKYKVAKHFKVEIEPDALRYRVQQDHVKREAALDGIYVIRTSLPAEAIPAEDAVRYYKRLTRVERAFRSIKTVDLLVRPIHHRLATRVRAHIFLCMLAYYVMWHMQQAWAPLIFADEVDDSNERDPVAPSRPSPQARRKASTKRADDGTPLHSFQSLLSSLATIVRNQCRRRGAGKREPRFELTTQPDKRQRRAFKLLSTISAT